MEGKLCIVKLERGRTHIGYLRKHPERGFWFLMENARVIRRWGTKGHGLAMLVNGPTNETILDDPATISFPDIQVTEIIENVSEEKWRKYL